MTTITTSSGGFIGPRSLNSHGNPTSCSRLRTVGIQSREVQTAPTYASGFQALKTIDLDIREGELFALLGPNGAGKTTLINIVCGIVTPTQGVVLADGHDIVAGLSRGTLQDRPRATGADDGRVRAVWAR